MAEQTPVAALRSVAEEAARRAGRVLAERFGGERTIEYKGGIDLVTDADRAAEVVLLEVLRERFPSHAILSEESGASAGADYRWVVDPLDGTTNYAHGVPHFCVSVAVEGRGALQAGVVYDPIRDELFSAGRGEGATLNGRPLRTSTAATLRQALLCTGFPYDVHQRPQRPIGLLSRFIMQAQGIRRTGSAALDLAYVAAGRFDGFFEFGLHAWDYAAGVLLVQEAGGVAVRVDGAPVSLECGDVLGCGAALAPALLAECAAFLEEVGYRPGA